MRIGCERGGAINAEVGFFMGFSGDTKQAKLRPSAGNYTYEVFRMARNLMYFIIFGVRAKHLLC